MAGRWPRDRDGHTDAAPAPPAAGDPAGRGGGADGFKNRRRHELHAPRAGIAALLGTGSEPDQIIVRTLRLARVLLALLAGAALALAGALLQRITRNPLATPSVLGITDGAAFGVVAFLWVFSDEANALTVSLHWQPLAAAIAAGAFATAVLALAGALTALLGAPLFLTLLLRRSLAHG